MKTIGLIGGMSWESSSLYYSLINKEVRHILGKSHSARCLLYSFDFQDVEDMQNAGEWVSIKDEIYDVGNKLKAAGADFIVLCTNTMHKVMDSFEQDIGIPLLHIVDVIGESIKKDGLATVGLLGTKFTMEESFYSGRIEERYKVNVIIPDDNDRNEVHRIIYDELVRGIIRDESRSIYLEIIDRLMSRGAEGIILGCTEIGLLVSDYPGRVYDSTILHAKQAAYLSTK